MGAFCSAPDDAGADAIRRDQCRAGALAGRLRLDDHDDLERAFILKLHFDARWLIAAGGAIMAVGSYMLATLNLQAGPMQIIWPRVVQMAGTGLMFAPLAAAAVLYLPKTEMNNASGLFNMLRNEGSSVGIGLSTAVLQRRLQFRLPVDRKPSTAQHCHDQRTGNQRPLLHPGDRRSSPRPVDGPALSAWSATSRPMRRPSSTAFGFSP